jgi:hypothetical protein
MVSLHAVPKVAEAPPALGHMAFRTSSSKVKHYAESLDEATMGKEKDAC